MCNALVNLKDNASYLFGITSLKAKEHSPEILTVSGVCSIIIGTVLACRATLKAEEILEAHEDMMSTIAQAEELADRSDAISYPTEAKQRDVVKAYAKTVGRFVIDYAPAVACIGSGIAMICAAHGILRKRNAALMAAYNAIDTAFKAYRQRVVNEQGQAQDMHYLTGGDYKVEELPDGTKRVIEDKSPDKKDTSHSIYDKFFDEASTYWKKDADANFRFLIMAQNQLNNKLRARGYIFLNEVYAALDIPPTPAGQIVGWVKTESSFIDLGIFDMTDERKRRFVNGDERSILIHPNVQGVIYDLL